MLSVCWNSFLYTWILSCIRNVCWRLSFLHWIVLAFVENIPYNYQCAEVKYSVSLICCLSFYQYHTVLITWFCCKLKVTRIFQLYCSFSKLFWLLLLCLSICVLESTSQFVEQNKFGFGLDLHWICRSIWRGLIFLHVFWSCYQVYSYLGLLYLLSHLALLCRDIT